MPAYAQIDDNNVVLGVSQLSGDEPDQAHMILLQSYDESLLGLVYDAKTGQFSQPAPPVRPKLVITGIAADSAHASLTMIDPATWETTCPIETGLTVTVEAHDNTGVVDGQFVGAFRLPLVATDGRERFLLAQFAAGKATITATMTESGQWQVTAQDINARLPLESQVDFSGLNVYVVM